MTEIPTLFEADPEGLPYLVVDLSDAGTVVLRARSPKRAIDVATPLLTDTGPAFVVPLAGVNLFDRVGDHWVLRNRWDLAR